MNIEKLMVSSDTSIRVAVETIDFCGIGIVFVVNDRNYVIGVVTDGDFRRAVLDNVSLSDQVVEIMNKDFVFVEKNYSTEDIAEKFKLHKLIQHIPVLTDGNLIDVIVKESFVGTQGHSHYVQVDLPVVIMAGGRGTRMAPFTHVLPKPLIPIGDKTMLEIIMMEYAKFGVEQYYISINYKGNIIKAYFQDHETDFNISYISEDKPLGTAGALKSLDGNMKTPFFVSNCDIIIKTDYSKIYEFHKEGNYALTLVASMQHHVIPYGVCNVEKNGQLISISEKPEYDMLVNSGMYILNPEVLQYIPENEFFHITHLMEALMKNGQHVGVYPVSERSWVDVGQWDEFKKALVLMGS